MNGAQRVGLVAAGRIAAALLQTLIIVVLARSSSLSDFGRFSVGYSIGTVIASVLNLGLPQYTLRSTGGDARRAPMLRGAGTMLALAAAAVTLGVSLVLQATGRGGVTDAGVAIAGAAAANVLSDAVSLINQTSLYSDSRVVRAVVVQLIVRAVATAAVLGATALRVDLFAPLAAAYLVAAAIGSASSGRLRLHLGESLSAVRGSVQYWRENLWALVQQLDVTVVSLFFGAPPAAAYAAGFRLASPIHIVTASISAIYVPQLSREQDALRRRVDAQRMLRFGLLYVGLLVLASPLALLIGPALLGAEYRPTAVLFPIFVINSALNVLAQLIAAVLWAVGEAKAVADATRLSTVSGLALIVLFAALHQLFVVACMTVVIQLILVPRLWSRLRRYWRTESVAESVP